jgi:heme exporter protein D
MHSKKFFFVSKEAFTSKAKAVCQATFIVVVVVVVVVFKEKHTYIQRVEREKNRLRNQQQKQFKCLRRKNKIQKKFFAFSLAFHFFFLLSFASRWHEKKIEANKLFQ